MWVIILLKRFCFFLAILFVFPFSAFASDCSASSAVVIDAATKTVLYEKNSGEKRSMASTTKIMTALLAVESGRLDEEVVIEQEMLYIEGSCLGLRDGDKLSFYDLVVGMMLTSGNDAANAVAFLISGSIEEFAMLMNNRAKELGMNNTVFVTPSGLDDGDHHSTAYDMALLTAKAVEYPEFCEITSMASAEITINGKKLAVYNHNKLLAKDEDIFGVKTGYTEKAGRCLVTAKNYNGNKIICVTLNAPDDWNDHLNLYEQCEKKYTKSTVSDNFEISAVGGNSDTVNVSYSKEIYSVGEVRADVYYYPFAYAPVNKGDIVGEVLVYCGENIIERLPIEADEDVEYAKQERSQTSEIYG